ncbi:hypothetical protein ACROYT_G013144 [Oculina patagonica]
MERYFRVVKRQQASLHDVASGAGKRRRIDTQIDVATVTKDDLLVSICRDYSYSSCSSGDTSTVEVMEEITPNRCEKACQTDLSGEDLDQLAASAKTLKDEAKLKRTMFVKDVTKTDSSVTFYTGLPSVACITTLFNHLETQAGKLKYWDGEKDGAPKNYQRQEKTNKPGRKRILTPFEEFVLTLVRIRLGLMRTHLSDIFGVSESTITKVFITWITFLCHELKSLIIWPSKQQIKNNLPAEFKKFPNTRVVIDCTEVFIEKPTLPSAQKTTWSEYKEHNTIKTLVGITPTGTFSFVSNFWTGSTSDRRITQESGFLDKLEEGDEVMADKGFNISDLIIRRKATLNIPPLAQGGKQLSRNKVTTTRRIASVRIHVERAIERLKNFKILQGIMPLTLMPQADSILLVCASLCNLLPPLVRPK